ncbi:hypothetical protein Y032_0020g100 [Ancylostoma ceylanicum]|uniref:Uncharacterized protein n=1 Tax=Ancylostoma ceylanicum TaxID=53326 RepID=A0A016UZI4_9BILA|nr:hypothetical protein Y032_0020g100 [Ancylostoma ceylanicum]
MVQQHLFFSVNMVPINLQKLFCHRVAYIASNYASAVPGFYLEFSGEVDTTTEFYCFVAVYGLFRSCAFYNERAWLCRNKILSRMVGLLVRHPYASHFTRLPFSYLYGGYNTVCIWFRSDALSVLAFEIYGNFLETNFARLE